jgi:hypothetical protein
MKSSTLAALLAPLCLGCTTMALEQYTLRQIGTLGELRDREVLHCLAQVAANPEALPSFAISGDGITRVTDAVTLSATTSWTRVVNGFAMQSLLGNANRSPLGTWIVDSVGDFERLEAMRCACQWALRGRAQCPGNCEILEDPQQFPDGKPHFGVAERLSRLPPGWVQFGRAADVPRNACYKGHCGHTWVWVTPEFAESFAQFELAIFDIALLDYQTIYLPRLLVTLVRDDFTNVKDVTDPKKNQAISVQEVRAIKPAYRQVIEDVLRKAMRGETPKPELTYAQWMEYTEPYHNQRTTQQPVLAPLPAGTGLTFQAPPHVPTRAPDRSNRSFNLQ